MMEDPAEGSIAAFRGDSAFGLQPLLIRFAERRLKSGLRIAGAVEIAEPSMGACKRLALCDIATGARYSIFQDLGRGSVACNLDTRGLAEACAAVMQAIERGVDVTVLSKFGKLEASGGGLLDCFTTAVSAGVPCVTAVAPEFAAPFSDYAGDYLRWVDPSDDAAEEWWAGRIQASRPAS